MKPFFLALRFLTRLPFPALEASDREVGRSALFFPFVGMLLGGVLLASYFLFLRAFPPSLARILPLVVLILVTGAFHLDGLGDTFDALYGGRDRESALRILKDPHLGSMGVVAILVVLLLKVAAVLSLPEAAYRGALLAMPVAGRAAMVSLLRLPYARSEGLGRAFSDHRSPVDAPLAALLAALAAFAALGNPGLLSLLAAAGAAGAVAVLAWLKLRGVTGDLCGAAGELAETAFLLALTTLA